MNIQLSINDRKILENAINIKGMHGKIDTALAQAEHKTVKFALSLLKKAIGTETKSLTGYVARRVRELRQGAREGFKTGIWLGTSQMYADKLRPNQSALRSGNVNQSQYKGSFVGTDRNGSKRIFARTSKDRLPLIRATDDVDEKIAAVLSANEQSIASIFSTYAGTAVKQAMLDHFANHKAKKR
jgi:hypothetical protein